MSLVALGRPRARVESLPGGVSVVNWRTSEADVSRAVAALGASWAAVREGRS